MTSAVECSQCRASPHNVTHDACLPVGVDAQSATTLMSCYYCVACDATAQVNQSISECGTETEKRDQLKTKWRQATNLEDTRLVELGTAYRALLVEQRYPAPSNRRAGRW